MIHLLKSTAFILLTSFILSGCGGGGGNSTGPNPGGGNNNPGGGTAGGGAVTHWYMSSGLGRDSQLWSISCPATNLCFVSGSNEILKSADSGQSWTLSYLYPTGLGFAGSGISFPDPLNGTASFGSGSNHLAKTVDGGNSWAASNVNFSTSFAFADSRHGASLMTGGIQYTIDGANTWTASAVTIGGNSTVLTAYIISKPVFVPSGSGFLPTGYAVIGTSDPYLNYTSYLLKTTNGGATWTDVPTGNGNQLFQVVTFTDMNHGWIGTFQGNVLSTTDGGATWTSHFTGNKLVTAISCVGASNCWVIAGNTLQATADGGATWTLQSPPAGGLITYYYDIHFVDTTHGIVVGYRYPTIGGAGSDFAAYTTTGGF